MSEAILVLKTSSLTLFCLGIFIILVRIRHFNNQKEPLIFLIILLILILKGFLDGIAFFNVFSTLFLLFFLHQFTRQTIKLKRKKIYDLSFSAAIVLMIAIAPLGLAGTVYFKLFYAFLCVLFAVSPFIALFRLYRELQKPVMLYLLIISVVYFISTGITIFLPLFTSQSFTLEDVFQLFTAVGIAYLLFKENYLVRTSFHGLSEKLFAEEKRSREAYSRLLSTEQSLVEQDRLISVGILAGGLAHEFKNILCLISNCSQYGLNVREAEKKDQSFAMINDHIGHSMSSVIRVLDQIRSDKKIETEELDLEGFLSRFIKVVKANYRGYGLDISFAVRDQSRVMVRKSDLEQILLNLVRNAANAHLKTKEQEGKKINILIRRESEHAVIDVTDNAGGITEETALRLFERHEGSASSTGLGLYLTKLLADNNDLTVRYACEEGQSRFSIFFPLLETDDAILS